MRAAGGAWILLSPKSVILSSESAALVASRMFSGLRSRWPGAAAARPPECVCGFGCACGCGCACVCVCVCARVSLIMCACTCACERARACARRRAHRCCDRGGRAQRSAA
eukprot:1168194-Prymnesium_polylepis.1